MSSAMAPLNEAVEVQAIEGLTKESHDVVSLTRDLSVDTHGGIVRGSEGDVFPGRCLA